MMRVMQTTIKKTRVGDMNTFLVQNIRQGIGSENHSPQLLGDGVDANSIVKAVSSVPF